MSKKNIEVEATATEATATEATEATEKKVRVSIKDKARKHIERIAKRGVVPMVFEEVLTAYAALGIFKYDEVLEMSDTYSSEFIFRQKNDN